MRKLLASLALVTLVPPATPARASHPSFMCLDVQNDEASPANNDDIVESYTAYPGASDAGHPPEQEGCVTGIVEPGQDWGGTKIDWEITGAGDPDGSDSPARPDATCTVPGGSDHCRVDAFEAQGEQVIRAWIDFDPSMVEADTAEGNDEETEPGNSPEPDGTDVARWLWTRVDPPPDMCGSDQVCWGRVTIDAVKGGFRGRWRRENGSCAAGEIHVRRKKPGRDPVVGEAFVSGPSWELIVDDDLSGRFYAVLSKTRSRTFYSGWPEYPCERDRSRVVTVD